MVQSFKGRLTIGSEECILGEMTKETRQSLRQCGEKEVLVFENVTAESNEIPSDAICVAETNQGMKKAVCKHECEFNEKCLQLCPEEVDSQSIDKRVVPSRASLGEIFPGTYFVQNSLKLHQHKAKRVTLYPEFHHSDEVEIQDDGSLRLKEKRRNGDILRYGQFCIELLDKSFGKGRYLVKTPWLEEEKEGELCSYLISSSD